ncbi:Hpt domain-containing protein [Sphingobium phenoxybenzoativorans]|uniref:Hpt domain-containing protein n=1 Tax=Sphingobium phenoxybenzoativorans TaxID=1592790 RepID=A0A975Q029_9SPHN|nr:Hpt domain-containing protein [Sphingobium phenoxybenzoativorans]QUT03958.1 Hpt domain-containing protein [Sphingobium phenoxybenzoativorans]
MSYDPGALDAALAAAVGDDAGLIADLRTAFLESAERQLDLLSRARCDANWQLAAYRLKGLAASFGVSGLMALADEAAQSAPGDPKMLRRLRAAVTEFALG